MPACRCGHVDAEVPHPCHGKGYTCRKPATRRFYGAHFTSLAGVQMKVGMHETWACDECWAAYQKDYLT